MFALAEEGHRSLFEQLVACILSIRTRDEVSVEAARRLFAVARRPERIARLELPRYWIWARRWEWERIGREERTRRRSRAVSVPFVFPW